MEGRAELSVEGVRFVPDLHEYILDYFLSFVCVTQDADGSGEKDCRHLIIKLRQRLLVVGGDAPQQVRLRFPSRLSIQHDFDTRNLAAGFCSIGTVQLM